MSDSHTSDTLPQVRFTFLNGYIGDDKYGYAVVVYSDNIDTEVPMQTLLSLKDLGRFHRSYAEPAQRTLSARISRFYDPDASRSFVPTHSHSHSLALAFLLSLSLSSSPSLSRVASCACGVWRHVCVACA